MSSRKSKRKATTEVQPTVSSNASVGANGGNGSVASTATTAATGAAAITTDAGTTKAFSVVKTRCSPAPLNHELLLSLLHTKVEHFVNPSNIVFVAFKDDKLVDVWKGLVKHKFLSTPVLLRNENRYYGSIDLADIVSALVKKFNREDLRSTEGFWKQLDAAKAFGEMTVGSVMQSPISRRNPFHPVPEGFSLLFALELLAREHNLHRIPIISANEDRKLVNMITQSQVVSYLNQDIPKIGSKVEKTLDQCPQFFKAVLSVDEKTIAIDAFEKMIEHNVSGLAIVNNEGRLVGNLSIRDLKLIGNELSLFWRFYQTVDNFVLKLRKEFQEKDERPRHVLHATREDTIATVLRMLAEHKVHRVYIVDNKKDKKPIGVVSLKDILGELIAV